MNTSFLSSGGKPYYWIGLYDNGSNKNWKWVTEEPYNYTNWHIGEPSDSFQTKVMANNSGKWLDNPDEGFRSPWTLENTGFVCEWESVPSESHHWVFESDSAIRCEDCGDRFLVRKNNSTLSLRYY